MKSEIEIENAIIVKSLHKSFKDFKVLQGIDFSVKKGSILAILGPNGAGKTTTVRILSTLLSPDEGSASVAGHDVVTNADDVRRSIGLTGQFAAVDDYLTGEENIKMIGHLYHLDRKYVERRAKELLEQFDLVEPSKRPVKTYSGGMKRRIDLAMSLIANPPVIFLDEPTTGLDPRSRLTMWAIIKRLAKEGTTILLTTQDMDEADNLADRIIVIDGGRVIADGTSDSLKNKVGSDRLELSIANENDFAKAKNIIKGDGLHADEEKNTISIMTEGGVKKLKEVLQILGDAHIKVENISLHRPTLDDVFLNLTGHTATKEDNEDKK